MDFDGIFYQVYRFASGLALLSISVGIIFATLKRVLTRIGAFILWFRDWKKEIWPNGILNSAEADKSRI